jgi:hypothetical protein
VTRSFIVGYLTLLPALLPETARGQETRGWNVFGAAYGWLAGVDAVVAVGPRSEFPVEVPFDDLLENVDFAISLHVEARPADGWTLMGDLFYADLGVSGTLPESRTEVTLDQRQTVLEGGVGYEVARDLELLAAVRYNDLSVAASTPQGEADERGAGWADAFAGVRFSPAFGERWLLSLRGDVGAGGSSFAWFVGGNAFYRLSETFRLGFGYRALSVDYESGEGRDLVKWDMVTHGLYLGLVMDF